MDVGCGEIFPPFQRQMRIAEVEIDDAAIYRLRRTLATCNKSLTSPETLPSWHMTTTIILYTIMEEQMF